MPTATDLVTDLPADFEVFGQAVATSMADLLGGATGQVLSKTTNADMDFDLVKVKEQSKEEYRSVKYDKLVALLVEAMKEQQKQIDELKKQVA